MTPPLFDVQQLTYLDNGPYSFTLSGGEIVGLSGASGVGKTQLLRAIVGCLPAAGRILYKGTPAESVSAPAWRRLVGLVPAESVWWHEMVGPHFAENSRGLSGDELVRKLGFDTDVLSWEVSRLSSGERQRLALVRALVLAPSVVLLDEPTAALDSRAVGYVEDLMQEYCRRPDTAIIWISHDEGQLRRVAQRCLIMSKKRLDVLWQSDAVNGWAGRVADG